MQLEINDLLVDLPAGVGLIRLQNAIAAVGELQTRTGEYSWPITLPPTRRNLIAFGAALLHPQALDKFIHAYRFRLSAEGQVWTGVFRLTSLKSGYTGSLSTDALGWARALGEKMLPELTSLAPVAYDGSQLEAILALNCDQTDVQFPLIAWGNFFSPPEYVLDEEGQPVEIPAGTEAYLTNALAIDDYPPSVYLLPVLRAVFAEAGYSLQGPILADAQVRQWCVTAAGSGGDFWPWGSLLPARADLQEPYTAHAVLLGTAGGNESGRDFGADVVYFVLPTTKLVAGGTRAMNTAAGGRYTAPKEGVYSFGWEAVVAEASQSVTRRIAGIDFNASYAAEFAPVAIGLSVFRDATGYAGADGGLCTLGTGAPEPGQLRLLSYVRLDSATDDWPLSPGTYGEQVAGVYLEAGDEVRLVAFFRQRLNEYRRKAVQLVFSAATLECTAFAGPLLLNPAAVLPALRQVDLVKDFLLRTNTVPVADEANGTVTLLSRPAHTASLGEPVELDDFCDPGSLEFLPVLGDAVRVVFSTAEAEDTVADTVSFDLPPGRSGAPKPLASPFAASGSRYYSVLQPVELGTYTLSVLLPLVATADDLAVPRSEVNAPDVASRTPRLIRYLGADTATRILFASGSVAWGRADYSGALAWGGDEGAVATRYREFLSQASRGHLVRVQGCLTPGRYAALAPGRRVYLLGAEYTIEGLSDFQPDNPTAPTTIDLLRRF